MGYKCVRRATTNRTRRPSRGKIFALAGILMLLGSCSTNMSFSSGGLAAGTSAADARTIKGRIVLPEGPGPFPAIVLLHGCNGLSHVQIDWQARLKEWGYASVLVDSNGSRYVGNNCSPKTFSWAEVAHDAYGAFDYLKALPSINAERIGVIGWSQGGVGAMMAIKGDGKKGSEPSHLFTRDPSLRFRMAVAYYPYCDVTRAPFYAPLLILSGSEDRWTPASDCEYKVEQSQNGRGVPALIKILSGATHSFDHGYTGIFHGQVIAYSSEATEDAKRMVKEFLQEHL